MTDTERHYISAQYKSQVLRLHIREEAHDKQFPQELQDN